MKRKERRIARRLNVPSASKLQNDRQRSITQPHRHYHEPGLESSRKRSVMLEHVTERDVFDVSSPYARRVDSPSTKFPHGCFSLRTIKGKRWTEEAWNRGNVVATAKAEK